MVSVVAWASRPSTASKRRCRANPPSWRQRRFGDTRGIILCDCSSIRGNRSAGVLGKVRDLLHSFTKAGNRSGYRPFRETFSPVQIACSPTMNVPSAMAHSRRLVLGSRSSCEEVRFPSFLRRPSRSPRYGRDSRCGEPSALRPGTRNPSVLRGNSARGLRCGLGSGVGDRVGSARPPVTRAAMASKRSLSSTFHHQCLLNNVLSTR